MDRKNIAAMRDKVLQWRRDNKLTQKHVGALLGLGRERYSTWENEHPDTITGLHPDSMQKLLELVNKIDAKSCIPASGGSSEAEQVLQMLGDKLLVLANLVRNREVSCVVRLDELESSTVSILNRLPQYRICIDNSTEHGH